MISRKKLKLRYRLGERAEIVEKCDFATPLERPKWSSRGGESAIFKILKKTKKNPKNRKSSSRAGEKAGLNETHGFLTDLEMSKSSSRLGESSIFKILQENGSLRFLKVTHLLEPIFCYVLGSILEPIWDQKSIKNLSLFQTSFSDAFWYKICSFFVDFLHI